MNLGASLQLKTLHYVGDDLQDAQDHIKRALHTLDHELPVSSYFTGNGYRPSLPAVRLVESELQEALFQIRSVLQQTEDK